MIGKGDRVRVKNDNNMHFIIFSLVLTTIIFMYNLRSTSWRDALNLPTLDEKSSLMV